MDRAQISEEAYTQALPNDEQIVELLETAYALRKKNDLTGAVRTCERALQIAPDSAAAHSLLGQLCAAQGERERAIREYEQVLRLNPGSIADRVKLDELRDEGSPKIKRIVPAMVVTGRERVAPSLFTLVSIGAAAIAIIAAGVAMNRPARSESANGNAGHAPNYTQKAAIANPTGAADTAVTKTGEKTGAANASADAASSAAANPAQNGAANLTSSNAAPNSARMNSPFVLPAAPLPAMNPAPAVPAAKEKNRKSPQPKTMPAPTDNRIVLSNNDSASGEGERYVIRINAGGAGKISGGTGKNSVVVGNNGNTGGAAENPPASEARSAISIADDLRYKGEFDKALQMYQRALPGAGDRAAHVYHQMAYCFQSKGDRSSAKVNYERAIEGYQKLAAGGHDVEADQSAIRVCQRGLKICE